MSMWKHILPIVFLAALVVYGVVDYVQDHGKSAEPQTHANAKKGYTDAQKGQSQTQSDKHNQNKDQKSDQDQTDKSKSTNEEVGLAPGNAAPDFKLQNLEGESVKLSDFRGKNVIVNFWATWCPPCRVEAPELEQFYKDNKDNNFTVLAVDIAASEKSPKSDVKSFVNQHGLTFPIVLDSSGDVSNTYQVMAYPTSYFVDKKGIIRQKVVGAMNKDVVRQQLAKMD